MEVLLSHPVMLLLVFLVIAHQIYLIRSIFYFRPGGSRPKRPEDLTFLEKVWKFFFGFYFPRPSNLWTPEDYGLDYEDCTLFSGKEQIHLWKIQAREAKARVILLHGWASAKYTLIPTAKVLNEAGFNCYLVDFQGAGESSGYETSLGVIESQVVRDVYSLVAAEVMNQDLPILIYGFSMGGVATLKAIEDYGIKPAGIILECVFSKVENAFRSRLKAGKIDFPGLARVGVFLVSLALWRNLYSLAPTRAIQRTSCPVLIIQGKDDLRVSLCESEELFQNCGSENKLLWQVDGISHDFAANQFPAEFVAKLYEVGLAK